MSYLISLLLYNSSNIHAYRILFYQVLLVFQFNIFLNSVKFLFFLKFHNAQISFVDFFKSFIFHFNLILITSGPFNHVFDQFQITRAKLSLICLGVSTSSDIRTIQEFSDPVIFNWVGLNLLVADSK